MGICEQTHFYPDISQLCDTFVALYHIRKSICCISASFEPKRGKAQGSDLTEERLVSAANLQKPRDRQYSLLVTIMRAHTSQS